MSYRSKFITRLVLASFSVLLASACAAGDSAAVTAPVAPESPVEDVSSVRVAPDSLDVRVGMSHRLTVEVRGRSNRVLAEKVTWVSSDPTIISVDSTGMTLALAAGTAEVRAVARGVTGRSRIRSVPEPVASVSVSPSEPALITAQQVALVAQARSASDSVLLGRAVRWTSSSSSIASVDTLGRVTARAAGSAVISAEIDGISGSATVVVAVPPPAAPGTVANLGAPSVTDTTVTLRFTEVSDGTGAAASYEGLYSSAVVEWAAATPVARGICAAPVSAVGVGTTRDCMVRGLVPGTAYRFQIVAFRGTLGAGSVMGLPSNVASATTNAAAVASVSLSPASGSALVGQTATFVPTVRDAAGNVLTGRTIAWSSSATTVATVSNTGVVIGVAQGTTEIRAVVGGVTGRATITIVAPPPAPVASVTVGPVTSTMAVGNTIQFTVAARDASGNLLTGRSVIWTSSNTTVATVSASGLATGRAAGSATIRATIDGLAGQSALTVTNPLPVSTIFESSWSTATGSGVAALTDGGRWDNGACPMERVLTVVPGSPLGFSETANVLRVWFNGGECGVLGKQNAYPQSTTHYVRFHFRNDEVGNRGDHVFAYNNLHSTTGFPIQAAPFSRTASNTPVGFWNASVITRFPYPYGRWFSPNLTNGVWYRYEYMFEYISATRYRVWPRIYSLAGTLLYDASNFTNEGDRITLQQYYDIGGANRTAELGVINGETPDAAVARHLGIGNEGPSTATNSNGYYYFAKLAFSTTSWIGR